MPRMNVLRRFFVNTTTATDVLSVIHEVNRAVSEAQVKEGLVIVLVPAPGAALAVLEPLPDIVAELKEALRIFPGEAATTQNRRKEEIRIGPRVVAAMLGKSMAIPVADGKPVLGPREEIVLIDLETTAKRREFIVQVMGEGAPQPEDEGAPRRR